MNDYGFYKTIGGVKMPALDAFRRSALTFDRACCASPVCMPSRTSVFSGLYPHITGAYYNDCDPWNRSDLLKRTETMPECFKRNGYETFGRGKLFHARLPKPRLEAMWDNRPIYGGGFGPFPEEKDLQFADDRFFSFKAWEGPDTDFPDVVNASAVVDFLGKDHDKPFFLTLGLWKPHTPFTAPKRFFDMYSIDDIPPVPPGFKPDDLDDVSAPAKKLIDVWGERFKRTGTTDPALWRRYVHAYCACTTFADWTLGMVLDALDKSKYADNTIVIFCSDNGFHCGEKNHWEKSTLWEQAARCPAFIRAPGMSSAGKASACPVSFMDFYPTLVDYCRLNPPKHTLEGHTLRSLVDDPGSKRTQPVLTTYGEGHTSLGDDRWRYIRYPDGTEELYDHTKDPHEFHNLAADPACADVKKSFQPWIPKTWAQSLGGRLG